MTEHVPSFANVPRPGRSRTARRRTFTVAASVAVIATMVALTFAALPSARTGVDIERMKKDMGDPAIQTAIDRNLELAQALRINGTPGFVIGEQILRSATDLKTLQALIREARDARN